MTDYELVCDSADRTAWHALRSTGIGASEMGDILGVSSWGSALTVYLGKVEPPPVNDDNEWMLWGRLLEGPIVDELARRAEVTIAEPRGWMLRSIAHPWATATPDAMTTAGEPVEAKNLAWGYDEAEWEAGIPDQYLYQCQHQMLVTGAARCLFGYLIHGHKMLWEWVPRNEADIERILVAGADMWRRIQERDEPLSAGHPRDRIALARRERDDAEVEFYHGEIEEDLDLYLERRRMRLRLEKEAKAAKVEEEAAANRIAQRLGTAQRGITVDGWSFAWRVTEKRGYTVAPTTLTQFQIKEPKEDKR